MAPLGASSGGPGAETVAFFGGFEFACIFGRFWVGAGGRGGACLNMQILQAVHQDSITPCSPMRGCGEFSGFAHAADPFGSYIGIYIGIYIFHAL